MVNAERLRFGITAEKADGPDHELDVQGLHLDVPVEMLEGASDQDSRLRSALLELQYSADVGITGFYDEGTTISRLNFGPDVLSMDSKARRQAQLVRVATVISGLERLTHLNAKDPMLKVGIIDSTVSERAGGLPLSVTVGWATGRSDLELAVIATSVGRSIGRQVRLNNQTHGVINNEVRAKVSRFQGVKMTIQRESPTHHEAGVWTSPAAYRPPSRVSPESQRFVVRGYNLAGLDESLVCLGSLIAMAHPEDVPPLVV